MAYVSSTYTDPSDTFVWWIEGDRLAIATIEGDANTSEIQTGRRYNGIRKQYIYRPK